MSTNIVAVHGSCDTSAVVEIGAALSLSGPLASLGRAELEGLELGVLRVDGSGGVLTSHRCLELMYKNNRSEKAVDGQALLDLVNEERVSVVVGPFLETDDSTSSHVGTLGVTALSFSAADETFDPTTDPYTFPVGSSAAAQAGVMAAFVKRRGWQDVTVIGSGSVPSDEAIAAFVAAIRLLPARVTVLSRHVDSDAAASEVSASAMSSHTDALVVFDDGSTLGPVLSARRALDWSVPVVAASDADFAVVPHADLAGVDVLVPAAMSVGRSVPSDLSSFRRKVLAVVHEPQLQGALTPYARGYDAVELFASAVNGVNADDPNSLRTYIENVNYPGLLGSYSYTSSVHQGTGESLETVVPLETLRNGLFVRAPSSH